MIPAIFYDAAKALPKILTELREIRKLLEASR